MRTRLLIPLAALGLVAGCTSFTDAATDDTSPSAGTSSSAGASTDAPAGDLEVTDQVDLGRDPADLTGVRLVADGDGWAVLLQGGPGGTVVTPDQVTGTTGTVLTDVAVVDGDPVAAALTADPVSPDPVVGLLQAAGSTAQPTDLEPQVTAPRGIPVLAAAGRDRLYLLAETPDGVGAQVLAVDPATARVEATADLDLGDDDLTSLALVGLVVTGDDQVVAGLDATTGSGEPAVLLVSLDADLEQQGRPTGPEGRLVGLTTDGDDTQALVAAADGGLTLSGPQGGRAVGDAGSDARVASVAAAVSGSGLTVVTAFLDQPSPTVVVTDPDRGTTTVQLCDEAGDAYAVAAVGDGTFLVAGSCEDTTVLWTLG